MKTILVDTNIILRFLLRDDEHLFKIANSIFKSAESGKTKIYIDELVAAETVWALTSFYKQGKKDVCNLLLKLVTKNWLVNPRKNLIIESLRLCAVSNLSYIDSWIAVFSAAKKIKLETFDKGLSKQVKN
jgi:predicted nucleic-acid-binding protein